MVPVDLKTNVVKLQELLYDQQDYEPSEEVKAYSKIIKEDTDAYLKY